MGRITQFAIVITLATSTIATACCGYDYTKEDLSGYNLQPNLQIDNDSAYARNGKAFYILGGFLYTMRFLRNLTETATSSSSSVSYSPKNAVPKDFYGFEIGFGKELNRHVDVQVAYLQNLRKTRHSTINGSPASVSGKMYGAQGLIGYMINPNDRFQVMPTVGALLYEITQRMTVGGVSYSISGSRMRFNPAAGVEFAIFCTKRFAFRLSALYAANTYHSASRGELNVMGGISYTL